MKRTSYALGLAALCITPSLPGADRPTLQSLGIAVDNAGHQRPADFATKMAKGIKLDQAKHGCNWAVRPEIYAFPDGVVYTAPGLANYNVFTLDTVLAKGCSIPSELFPGSSGLATVSYENQVDMNASYAVLTLPNLKLDDQGNAVYKVGDRNKEASSTLVADMQKGLQLTQAQHACKWASRPFIYVFADGVVYLNADGKNYNIFSHKEATNQGCKLPKVQAASLKPVAYYKTSETGDMSTMDDATAMDMAADMGMDDMVTTKPTDMDTGSASNDMTPATSVIRTDILETNLKKEYCEGQWSYIDQYTITRQRFDKVEIRTPTPRKTGHFVQIVDVAGGVKTLRFPVTNTKYFSKSQGAGYAESYIHAVNSAACQQNAPLQQITTTGDNPAFQVTLALNSSMLKDSNNQNLSPFISASLIHNPGYCSDHEGSGSFRRCNQRTVTDFCEVKYYNVIRNEKIVVEDVITYTDKTSPETVTINKLRATKPGLTKADILNPENTIPDDDGFTLRGKPHTFTCLSGDDKPLATEADVQERYKFLDANIHQYEVAAAFDNFCQPFEAPDCSISKDPGFIALMKNNWGLYQEKFMFLTPEQRQSIVERHQKFPTYVYEGHKPVLVPLDIDVED